MNTKTGSLSLAALATACALVLPSVSYAGNVGHYNGCGAFTIGDLAGPITAAGHTKVPVASLDAASLAGLDALVVTTCYGGPFNAPTVALGDAVAGGMGLVVESLGYNFSGSSGVNSAYLPGAPTFSTTAAYAYPATDNIELAVGSPISSGPGGTLTSTSLDRGLSVSMAFNFVFGYPIAQLPAGATPFLTTADPNTVVAFGYGHGSGRVAYSDSQSTLFLPGGTYPLADEAFAPGLITYLTNAIAWAAGYTPVATTCASEGYTGTKLVWCQNICEKGYTGATLQTWIHRWIRQFRDLPYCAVEPANGTT